MTHPIFPHKPKFRAAQNRSQIGQKSSSNKEIKLQISIFFLNCWGFVAKVFGRDKKWGRANNMADFVNNRGIIAS